MAISTYFLLLAALATTSCWAAEEDLCNYFTCTGDTTLQLFETELSCPEGLVCNSKCVSEPPAKPAPCVEASDLCPFECNFDGSGAIVEGITLNCPIYTKCNNEEPRTTCDVCVPDVCPKQTDYRCITATTVEYKGIANFTCPENSLCNQKNQYPCSMCIEQPEGSITTPSTPPTTLTTPTTPTTTTLATTPTTTTTTTTTTPPTPKPTEENCNDGYGGSNPCRYGPTGYYYKCIQVGSNYFVAELKYCSNLPNDPVCKRYRLC